MTRTLLFGLVLIAIVSLRATAQDPREFSVLLSATVHSGEGASITLHWDADPNTRLIRVGRKLKSETSFPNAFMDTPDSNHTQWTDLTVEPGVAYEYRVIRQITRKVGEKDSTWIAVGYISAGTEVLPERRTRVLVLVDSTMITALQPQLQTLQADLENEGWTVTILNVPRAETFDAAKVMRVRSLIKLEQTSGGNDIGAVLLLGRVPVPYSGVYALDGHPDHAGAWPADGIYGDLDGVYTDASVNVPNASRPTQNNVPGDGKYDQVQFSGSIKLPVGRVDFYNLPAFDKAEPNHVDEFTLLQRYLKRNHDYRTTSPKIKMGGIVDDNFGTYGEHFAASGWRLFSLFGGDTAVRADDFFGTLANKPTYLMAYGCGGGTDVGAGGVGSSTDFVDKQVNAVFTFLFGSYFGDWDTQNNFLRSSLASNPSVLTCSWSGRPHLYLHHMALGETIGYSYRLTQNATSASGYFPWLDVNSPGSATAPASLDRFTHISLLGDPTLRAVMQPVAQVNTVTATSEFPDKVKLSWVRPVGDADAYLVFRRRGSFKKFTQLTTRPITETSFVDSTHFEGEMEYQVQAVALRSTASGTFYDYGKPTSATVLTTTVTEDNQTVSGLSLVAAPNPAQTEVTFIITNDASVATTSSASDAYSPVATTLSVHDMLGRTVWSFEQNNLLAGRHTIGFDASALAQGRYIVRLTSNGRTTTTALTIAR